MSRELAYIRNGKINTNAAKFMIPVSQDLDAIHLAWWAHPNSNRGAMDNSASTEVSYRIYIESKTTSSSSGSNALGSYAENSVEDAMYQPSLNVSHSGRLPTKEQIVRISLPCTGRIHAIVDIDITINFDISKIVGSDHSSVELKLKRQKTCAPDSSYGVDGKDSAGDVDLSFHGSLIRLIK